MQLEKSTNKAANKYKLCNSCHHKVFLLHHRVGLLSWQEVAFLTIRNKILLLLLPLVGERIVKLLQAISMYYLLSILKGAFSLVLKRPWGIIVISMKIKQRDGLNQGKVWSLLDTRKKLLSEWNLKRNKSNTKKSLRNNKRIWKTEF